MSGPDVRVTIVKIDRNSIRIGIEAPGDVSVQREEIVFELPQSHALESRGRLKSSSATSRPRGLAIRLRWTDRGRSSMLASSSPIH